jgi:hypothetical protein
MSEETVEQRLATLRASRAGVVSALVMHVERSERLVAERDRMDAEIEELEKGAQA